MRRAILYIAAGEGVLLALAIGRLAFGYIRSDAAGRGMAQAFSIIACIGALLLIVPAVVLANNNRWLWFDLALVSLALLLALVSVMSTL